MLAVLLAEDVVFEYIVTVPGYPRRVAGRQAVAELYRPTAPRSCSTVAMTWPFITTRSPEYQGSHFQFADTFNRYAIDFLDRPKGRSFV